jgi:iron complex transport system substrate-binding protein
MRALYLTAMLAVSLVAAGAGVGAASPTIQDEECSFPYTATDASGQEVTIEQRPERVTTLAPSAAQTMWELDAQSQVVGVTKFALYLDGAESKANVSAEFGADVEAVIGTNPDLVLAPNVTSPETVRSLRDASLTVFLFEGSSSIQDVRNKTTRIGRLTGNCQEAGRTNEWMMQNVDAARNATADVEQPSVLYPLGGGFVAGSETFIHATIRASGGANAAAEYAGYPQLDDEDVVALQPDVLLITESNRFVLSQEPYASTPAGQNNRTVDVGANWLNQPAPRSVVYAVRNMTEQLHPDAHAEAEFVVKSEVTVETESPTPTPSPTEADETPTATPTGGGESGVDQPGFGLGTAVLAAIVALAAAGFATRE